MKGLRTYTHVLPVLLALLKEVGEIVKGRRISLERCGREIDEDLPSWFGRRGDYTLIIEPRLSDSIYTIEVRLTRREESNDVHLSILMSRAGWYLDRDNLSLTFEEVQNRYPPGTFGDDTETVINDEWAFQQPLADLYNSLAHISPRDRLTACKMVVDFYAKCRPQRRQRRNSNQPTTAPSTP